MVAVGCAVPAPRRAAAALSVERPACAPSAGKRPRPAPRPAATHPVWRRLERAPFSAFDWDNFVHAVEHEDTMPTRKERWCPFAPRFTRIPPSRSRRIPARPSHEALGASGAARRAYGQALRTLDPDDARYAWLFERIDPADVAAACAAQLGRS
jgi:hypothetical protein